MLQFELKQFSGPLDLLLQLIQEKKMAITEIAISEVTEQYVRSIEGLDEADADELSDFLVVASKLLLHKSRMLLPEFFPEEEDGPSLEQQLKLYKLYVDASKDVHACWVEKGTSVFRREPVRFPDTFVPPENVSLEKMGKMMQELVTRLAPPKPLPQVKIDRTVSVKEKILEIKSALKKIKQISFHSLLKQSRNKSELIVGFLALLELVKQKNVHLSQDETFGDILIEKT